MNIIMDLIATLWPDSYGKIVCYFYCLVFIEQIFLIYERGINNMKECLTSMNHGVFYESVRLFTYHIEEFVYFSIYEYTGGMILNMFKWEEYRIYSWTGWCIGFIATDFFYYWIHRYKHEVHLLWVFHQVHHGSEMQELSVGVRQSAVELFYDFIFYSPIVCFLNPYYVIKSRELIYLYNLFLHTTFIKKLGPLEQIFNTPSHHRIHHANNKYCVETNYGGVFIIWDRIFSTFCEERSFPPLLYGLSVSPKYYHIIYQQISGILNLIRSKGNYISYKGTYLCKSKLRYASFFYSYRWRPLDGSDRRALLKHHIRREHKSNNFVNYWNFHNVYHAHFIIFINALELYLVRNMDYKRIIRAFENMLINFSIYGFFYDRDEKLSIMFNFLRSYALHNMYYDSPEWCSNVYSIMFLHDSLQFLNVIIINGITNLMSKLSEVENSGELESSDENIMRLFRP